MFVLYLIISLIYISLMALHFSNQHNVKSIAIKCNNVKLSVLSHKKVNAKLKNVNKILKLKPLKTKCLYNIKFYLYGNLLKNFKVGFINNKIKVLKVFTNQKLNGFITITKQGNNYNVKCKNAKNLQIVLINYVPTKLKTNFKNFSIKINNYNYNFKQTFVLNVCSMQTSNFDFNTCVMGGNNITMQSVNATKKPQQILNQKVVGFFPQKNAVKLKNFNQPLSNIFNLPNLYVLGSKRKQIVNRTYLVEYDSNFIYVSKLGVENNFNFKQIFNFKIQTKNVKLNNLVNNILPSKMVSEYKNNFNFVPFSNLINKPNSSVYYYKTQINYYLKTKQYILAYNFILTQVLGVGLSEQKILFFKPQYFIGSYLISYFGNKLLINNHYNNFSVLFNGIVYKNISNLKLPCVLKQETKVT